MHDFYSPLARGFMRAAAATIPVKVADPSQNARSIIEAATAAGEAGASLVVFPELTLSGNTAGDLLYQDVLLQECDRAVEAVVAASENWPLVAVFGAPVRAGGRLLNAAIAVARGEIVGVFAKSEESFAASGEARWFSPVTGDATYLGVPVVASSQALIAVEDVPGLTIGLQIGEQAGSYAAQARAGATVIAHMSGAPAVVGSARERRESASVLSRSAHVAVVFSGAGDGESTTDFAWDSDAFIFEDGELLGESERYAMGAQLTYADIDLRVLQARQRDSRGAREASSAPVSVLVQPKLDWELTRVLPRFPYIDNSSSTWDTDLEDAFNLQVQALMQRLRATGNPHPVIGISGGLDSTQALLVCIEAMDRLGRPRTDILTFTLPGFATTAHTKNNAIRLCETLGTTFEEIDIRDTARQMLKDMGHPFGRGEEVYDVTFENVQAGLRTDFLFRIANARRGVVIGTGDYSELMLGWCTYGVGDHMSHYSVNPGIPKTLMQHLIRWIIRTDRFGEAVNSTLDSILNTEITPELIPTREGEEAQSTEVSIGPYELQDFNAYHLIHLGLSPEDTAFRALTAWGNAEVDMWPEGYEGAARRSYTLAEILTWERVFLRRFFANQFKRSTLPNGPRVLEGANLSPRGGLMLGSDIASTAWLARIDQLAGELGIELEKR
ncbi:MAG: NAD(+) synthase [Actinomycetaceae bacterium]|nr:NAD(+) synthase [Actinomycetaceae bacterium]